MAGDPVHHTFPDFLAFFRFGVRDLGKRFIFFRENFRWNYSRNLTPILLVSPAEPQISARLRNPRPLDVVRVRGLCQLGAHLLILDSSCSRNIEEGKADEQVS
jgi:hypothetical protein